MKCRSCGCGVHDPARLGDLCEVCRRNGATGAPYCNDRTFHMIGSQWRTWYKGLEELEIRNDRGGGIRILVRVGRRWASLLVEDAELYALHGDTNAYLEYIDDRVRTAWLSAGGGDALDIPFRIGLRSPKRLQIRRERGFEYPRRMA